MINYQLATSKNEANTLLLGNHPHLERLLLGTRPFKKNFKLIDRFRSAMLKDQGCTPHHTLVTADALWTQAQAYHGSATSLNL